MAASKPIPPMTTKRSSSRAATSRRTRSPATATWTASSSELGMSKLVASRLPVPPGSTARGTSVPARPVTQAITVPSPPWAMTRSTPSARALAVWPWPGSSLVVSSHRTSRPAPSRAASVSRRRRSASSPPPVAGLNTTATRRGLPMAHLRAPPGPAAGAPTTMAQGPVGHAQADAADGGAEPDQPQQGAAEHVGEEVHAPVHPRGGDQQGQPERQGEEDAPDQRRAGPLGGEHGQRPPQRYRGGGVPGGEAGGRRRLVQVADRRPLAVDQQGDGEEDRHLAGHRHRHQHGLAPAAPQQSGHRHRHHGQGGDGQGAADLGGDGGGVVELAVALTGQPPADARVGPADGVVL